MKAFHKFIPDGPVLGRPLSKDLRERLVPLEDVHRVPEVLGTNGVVFVTGVFSAGEARALAVELIDNVAAVSDGADPRRLSTWTQDRLLPQLKPGVFQFSNFAAAWKVRACKRVRTVFAAAHGQVLSSKARKRMADSTAEPFVFDDRDLVGSVEMVNVTAPVPPFHDPSAPDWAHFDNPKQFAECLQGHVALSPSTGCFVVSPRSHVVSAQLQALGMGINTDMGLRAQAQRLVEDAGGRFQVPCPVPPGTLVVFTSRTLHSNKTVDAPCEALRTQWMAAVWRSMGVAREEGRYPDGWRCVVYLAFRRKSAMNPTALRQHLAGLWTAFTTNRITKHSGRLFPEKGWDKYPSAALCSPEVRRIFDAITAGGQQPVALTPDVCAVLGI
jgi:hypothetical protein